MANCSVAYLKDMDIKDRIDAEYFQSEFLETANRLEKHSQTLDKFATPTVSAFYPAATQVYSIGEVPFIRCVDVIDYPILSILQENKFEKLPKWFIQENKTVKTLHSGDIVISKVGTPCYASVIDESLKEVAISRTVLGLTDIKIDPYYLVAFLRSKYGFLQLHRECELTIQLQLTLERVGRVKVYNPTDKEKIKEISGIMKAYFKSFRESIDAHKKAQQMLSEELSLNDFQLNYKLSYIDEFSVAKMTHRIDAEYFQPAYENIIHFLSGKAILKSLRQLSAPPKKGIEVGSLYYRESGKPFIRVSNLTPNGFDKRDQKCIGEELYMTLQKDYGVQVGDFLLSKDATPGIAFVVKNPTDGILSSGILKLKIDEKEVDKEYLALCINELIGKLQIERDSGGSVIVHWRPKQVKNLKIPILSRDVQQRISDLVVQSYETNLKANELVKLAITKTETMIEQAM